MQIVRISVLLSECKYAFLGALSLFAHRGKFGSSVRNQVKLYGGAPEALRGVEFIR